MTTCDHNEFHAKVNVARMEDIGRFMAEITIECAECGAAFEFQGLQPGLNLNGATCSVDGREARIAITPPGLKPNPLHKMTGTGTH